MIAERGGKAIIATCVGAWLVTWGIIILAEIHIIAAIIGVPTFVALLVAWVLQKSGKENTESEVPPDAFTD
ncbi:hypothetical protein ACFL3H_08880 [Gemmatimonadota bacterium]